MQNDPNASKTWRDVTSKPVLDFIDSKKGLRNFTPDTYQDVFALFCKLTDREKFEYLMTTVSFLVDDMQRVDKVIAALLHLEDLGV